MSAAVAISNTPEGWSRFEGELGSIVEALTGLRLDDRPIAEQLVEAIEARPLRLLACRRAATVRPGGCATAPIAFSSSGERSAAMHRLRVEVDHDARQRALVDALLAGRAALTPGQAVVSIETASRLNGRALLELGRPVVALGPGGRLVVDEGSWPDPVWAARCGFAAALRGCVRCPSGGHVDRGPTWIAPDGQFGAVCPPASARWVELLSAGGGRPDVRLIDERLSSGRLRWSAALDRLAEDAAASPAPAPARSSGGHPVKPWPANPRHQRMAEDICGDHGISPDLVAELMEIETRYRARPSRSGVLGALQGALDRHLELAEPKLPAPALVLVGCVKGKAAAPAPARDLYRGQLWTLRRRYAEARGLPWGVVSAGLGVIDPDAVIEPYEQRIEDLDAPARETWATLARAGLGALLADVDGRVVEVIAGAAYVEALRPIAEALGVELSAPLAGLGIGKRKRWLATQIAALGERPVDELGDSTPGVDEEVLGGVRKALGAFVDARRSDDYYDGYCWWVQHPDGICELPAGDERDPGGWEVVDVVAELAAAPPPVGWVLCGMHQDADWAGHDEDWGVFAVRDDDGWALLAGARARAFARDDAPIGRWWPVGDVGLVDTCHDQLERACRWAARAEAQLAGAEPAEAIDWDRLDPSWWAKQAAEKPLVARRLLEAMPARQEMLRGLPMCGPLAPAAIGPAAFSEAWAQGHELTVDRETRQVRRRRAPQGRGGKLSMVAYVQARGEVQAAGEDSDNNSAIARHTGIHRCTVIRVRKKWDALSAAGLAELDAAVRARGLEVVASLGSGAIQSSPRARSFMYWCGGKGRLVDDLLAELPAGRFDYCEPFLGGGALFRTLAAEGRIRQAVLNDADPDIAHLWQMVQRDPDGVFAAASAWPWTREAYFKARDAIDVEAGVRRAGAVLRVIQHARNAIWRRRKDGKLTMPPGVRKGQTDINVSLEDLREVSRYLAGVTIRCVDAEQVIDQCGRGWVVYGDPPYYRTTKVKPRRRTAKGLDTSTTSSFSYDGRGFQAGDVARTIGAFRRLADRGGLGIMSQSSTGPVLQLVEAAGGTVRWVTVLRSVSSKASGREVVPEIVARFGRLA